MDYTVHSLIANTKIKDMQKGDMKKRLIQKMSCGRFAIMAIHLLW